MLARSAQTEQEEQERALFVVTKSRCAGRGHEHQDIHVDAQALEFLDRIGEGRGARQYRADRQEANPQPLGPAREMHTEPRNEQHARDRGEQEVTLTGNRAERRLAQRKTAMNPPHQGRRLAPRLDPCILETQPKPGARQRTGRFVQRAMASRKVQAKLTRFERSVRIDALGVEPAVDPSNTRLAAQVRDRDDQRQSVGALEVLAQLGGAAFFDPAHHAALALRRFGRAAIGQAHAQHGQAQRGIVLCRRDRGHRGQSLAIGAGNWQS